MVKVILHGCNGKMGHMITEMCSQDEEIRIVAGVDALHSGAGAYPVYRDIYSCNIAADVVIDFSTASAVDTLLDYCTERKLPCVLCTTGLSQEQLAHVKEASKKTAILRSANMTLGINLLMKVLKEAAAVLAPAGFDIEIVEKHHNQKVDSPSGTALLLADALAPCDKQVIDRNGKRNHGELGITSVRGGGVVGEHEIGFYGEHEIVTISHSARSRELFAAGAFKAADFLLTAKPALYDMDDVVASLL